MIAASLISHLGLSVVCSCTATCKFEEHEDCMVCMHGATPDYGTTVQGESTKKEFLELFWTGLEPATTRFLGQHSIYIEVKITNSR